jgi:hypothetical protein
VVTALEAMREIRQGSHPAINVLPFANPQAVPKPSDLWQTCAPANRF